MKISAFFCFERFLSSAAAQGFGLSPGQVKTFIKPFCTYTCCLVQLCALLSKFVVHHTTRHKHKKEKHLLYLCGFLWTRTSKYLLTFSMTYPCILQLLQSYKDDHLLLFNTIWIISKQIHNKLLFARFFNCGRLKKTLSLYVSVIERLLHK